jgi:hypothetical protein
VCSSGVWGVVQGIMCQNFSTTCQDRGLGSACNSKIVLLQALLARFKMRVLYCFRYNMFVAVASPVTVMRRCAVVVVCCRAVDLVRWSWMQLGLLPCMCDLYLSTFQVAAAHARV